MTVAELAIGGMTCASCAARIERKLNRLDGVSAAVNFATETARVTFPAWQFPDWQWACLALASPVAVWGAWPFHRAALAGARHGAATMDTLISTGVSAAYLWSLYALISGGDGETYLEVAAGVTALVL